MASIISKDTSGNFLLKQGEVEDSLNRSSKRFLVKDFQDGKKQYRIVTSIGPIHYNDDVLNNSSEWHEIDLDLHPVWNKGWRYECNTNGYQIRIWNKYGLSSFYTACFLRADKWIKLSPLCLCYENDNGERQIISNTIPNITPIIDNDNNIITWKNCFGEGIDFRYNLTSDKFFKTIIINSLNSLPEIFIENIGVRLTLFMALSWDGEANNNFGEKQDLSVLPISIPNKNADEEILNFDTFSILREEDGKEIFWMQNPKSWDYNNLNIPMEYQLRRYDNQIIGIFSVLKEDIINSKFPIFIDTAITEESIETINDDGYSWGRTVLANEHQTLDMATNRAGYFKGAFDSFEYDITGNRFTTVPIPKDATIDEASLTWYCYTSGVVENNIYGALYSDAPSFVITPIYDFYNNKTNSFVNLNLLENKVQHYQNSPDVSEIVTEIISNEAWEENNNLAFLIAYNGPINPTSSHLFVSKARGDGILDSFCAKFNCTYTITSTTLIKNINNLDIENIKKINNLSIDNKKNWNGLS